MYSNTGTSKALSYFTASFPVFLIILPIPGNFLVCLAIIKDPFRNLKTPFNYFLLSLASTDLVVGTIMDSVSVAFRISEGLQLNIVDIKILHILYFIFMHGVYFNTHGTYRGEICGRIIASEVQNNGYLQARYLTSLSIWLAALGFSFAYFQLGFIFYSFIFTNTAVLSTFGVLIFVHVGILKRLRQRSRYWRKRG